MPLADDQNMIQVLTPKRSDQAFSGKSRLRMRFVQSLQNLHHRRQSAAFSPAHDDVVIGLDVPRLCCYPPA